MSPVQSLVDHALDRYAGETLSVPEKLVVAPCVGQFRPAPPDNYTAEGEIVDAGQVVGYVEAQDRSVPVRSAFAGWLMGVLVHEGERVREGQPIAWLRSL